MRAHRVVLGLSLLFIVGSAAVDGCGSSTPPALGLEGAGCYSDGSCNSQLVCMAKVCRRPAAGSTAGAGGGTAGAGADDGGAGRDAATDVETAADGAAATDAAATESGHDAVTVESGHDSAGDDVTDGSVEVGSDAICAAATCATNAPWSQIACACVPIVDGGARDGVSAIEAGDDAAAEVGGDI
ncbi:MAG TPA: hypothetical protein VH560_12645 [Polyangia bacterium]|jgi:hypothetical protein|nr:hypothetical protein [Polyangia bacterium]